MLKPATNLCLKACEVIWLIPLDTLEPSVFNLTLLRSCSHNWSHYGYCDSSFCHTPSHNAAKYSASSYCSL